MILSIPLTVLLVLIIITSIVLSNRIQRNINHINIELIANELTTIMQDDSEEEEEIIFSINNLINQTLEDRKQ